MRTKAQERVYGLVATLEPQAVKALMRKSSETPTQRELLSVALVEANGSLSWS